MAPSTPLIEEGETHSIPETPRLIPDHGAHSPEEAVGGSATRIEGKDVHHSDSTSSFSSYSGLP